jgi:pimeloyl-ACP methyl ester carboxylesterase
LGTTNNCSRNIKRCQKDFRLPTVANEKARAGLARRLVSQCRESTVGGDTATPVEGWWNTGSTTPLLVIEGLRDVIAPPENGHMMKQEMAGPVELLDIDGAGHAMLPEQPEKIAEATIGFSRKLAAAK